MKKEAKKVAGSWHEGCPEWACVQSCHRGRLGLEVSPTLRSQEGGRDVTKTGLIPVPAAEGEYVVAGTSVPSPAQGRFPGPGSWGSQGSGRVTQPQASSFFLSWSHQTKADFQGQGDLWVPEQFCGHLGVVALAEKMS